MSNDIAGDPVIRKWIQRENRRALTRSIFLYFPLVAVPPVLLAAGVLVGQV